MFESIFSKNINLIVFLAAALTINPTQSYARIACKDLQSGKILHMGKCSPKELKKIVSCDLKQRNGHKISLHPGVCTSSELRANISCFLRSSDGRMFYYHPGECEQGENQIVDFCARGNRVSHLGSCDQ